MKITLPRKPFTGGLRQTSKDLDRCCVTRRDCTIGALIRNVANSIDECFEQVFVGCEKFLMILASDFVPTRNLAGQIDLRSWVPSRALCCRNSSY